MIAAAREIEWWLPVPGARICEVSTLGRFRRTVGNRKVLVKPSPTMGYLRVSVRFDIGTSALLYLQRVVLLTWLRAPVGREQACHFPDVDTRNCRLSNLRWGSRAENGVDTAAMNAGIDAVAERLQFLRASNPHLSRQPNQGIHPGFWGFRDPDLGFFTDPNVGIEGFSPEALAC